LDGNNEGKADGLSSCEIFLSGGVAASVNLQSGVEVFWVVHRTAVLNVDAVLNNFPIQSL